MFNFTVISFFFLSHYHDFVTSSISFSNETEVLVNSCSVHVIYPTITTSLKNEYRKINIIHSVLNKLVYKNAF